MGLAGNIYSGGEIHGTKGVFSGTITTSDATDSVSTATGSIVTSGGLGIPKTLYVGTGANISGNSQLGQTGIGTAPDSHIPLTIQRIGSYPQLQLKNHSTNDSIGYFYVPSGDAGGLTSYAYGGTTNPITIGMDTYGNVVTIGSATESSTTSTGALIVTGGIGLAKKLCAGGAISTSDTTASTTTSTGCIVGGGGMGVAGNIYSGGEIHGTKGVHTGVISTSDATASTTTATGCITGGGGLGIAGAINSGGIIATSDTTASTTTGTGCITGGGGLGVAGNIYSGGEIHGTKGVHTGVISTSDSTASTTTGTGCITGGGGLGVAGNIYAGGEIHGTKGVHTGVISTSDSTASTTTATGCITGGGGLGVAGNIYSGGEIHGTKGVFSGTITTSDATEAASTSTGSIVTSGGIGAAKRVWATNMTCATAPSLATDVLRLTDCLHVQTLSGTWDKLNNVAQTSYLTKIGSMCFLCAPIHTGGVSSTAGTPVYSVTINIGYRPPYAVYFTNIPLYYGGPYINGWLYLNTDGSLALNQANNATFGSSVTCDVYPWTLSWFLP
jgi:hypothetical protein